MKDISHLNQPNVVTLPAGLRTENCEINGELKIVNELNKHFTNIADIIEKSPFNPEHFRELKCVLDEKIGNKMFHISCITPLEVKQIIDKLDVSKSTGLDGIGPKVIKHCGDSITLCIASMINHSIRNGIFPDSLKTARVIPLFKSGLKEDPNNYRPISILPTISKIFERHIANQVQSFLHSTHAIHTKQSGFRENHSCSTALTV